MLTDIKKQSRRVRGVFTGLLFAGAIVLLFLVLRWWEHSQVYHPSRDMAASGADLGRPWEDVSFRTSDGIQLNSWFFTASSESPRGARVILICHGNGGNISHRLDLYRVLLETGVNVFAFDFRGYGRSEGRPSEEGTYLDAQAAWQWLNKKGFSGRDILVYGESLGGGVASELCLREPTGGLILQSTFTSIPDIGADIYPWLPVRWISSIKYDTHSKLPRIHVPVLVMHSRSDGLIGFGHAERNFKAANEPKLFCEIRGPHNDALEARDQFANGIENFLRQIERKAGGQP